MRRRDAGSHGGRVCEWGWGLRGEMGVYVPLGSCEADTPVLFLLCKKNVFALQGSIFCTTAPIPTHHSPSYEHKSVEFS